MEKWSNAKGGDTRNYSGGFLCHYLWGNGSAQYIFLDVDDQGFAVVNQSLSFCIERNAHVCASCIGLLLFACGGENSLCYNVYNLFTKQCVQLPRPQMTRRSLQTGLAFDGHHDFQVVRIFNVQGSTGESSSAAAGGEAHLEMEIFSSETGIWRHFSSSLCLPPELPKLSTTPLFSNGAIHWDLGTHLLIYRVKDGHLNLVELPNSSPNWSWYSMTFGQCLWESQGYVHYSYSDYQGIHSWVLLKEQDHDLYSSYGYVYDREKFTWKLVHTVTHKTLMSQNPEIFSRVGKNRIGQVDDDYFSQWKPYFISPCMYDADLQLMYLRLPGTVVSYNIRTQTLNEICTFAFPNINFHCCLVIPIVYSLHGGSQVAKSRPTPGNEVVIRLPIEDAIAKSNRCGSTGV